MAERRVTKKVINSPETCVDDNLRGVVAVYPALHLHPKHRVITLRNKIKSERVAILGGGGSGHEPFAAGLVGHGMLDGAVAGGIFASPPTGHVLYGIAQLYKYNSGGVLVIIGNYTGDRLNFGKAIEKAKIAGIKVEGLIVGEDVASSQNKTGGRSMVGEVIFYKLCGAMAQKGYQLAAIRSMAAEANKYMATLGVCLSACSLPGQPPLFEIADGEMELGAGVHGEAGIKKMKLGTAKEVVKIILDQVVDHLKLKSGDRVAVTVDNLGGTSFLEMNIICAETKDYFETNQMRVERIYAGHLKTSLEMHAFQICVLHLNKTHGDLWLELLDAPTDALGWTGGEASKRGDDGHGDDDSLLHSDGRKVTSGPSLTPKQQEVLRECLTAAANQLVQSEDLLNRLDSGCGDGDCGITLKKFAKAVLSYLETASLEYPSNVLWELSEIAETDMGGTSGGIYSLGLSAASQAIGRYFIDTLPSNIHDTQTIHLILSIPATHRHTQNPKNYVYVVSFEITSATNNDPASWLSAWEHGMQAITKYGGAEAGDRTMLDTLLTAATTFRENLNKDLGVLMAKTCSAAEAGCKATTTMTARAGRASYVASGYIHDEDAGARAAAIWLQAVLKHIADAHKV